MIRNFISFNLVLFSAFASSQVITYVGNSALVTIQSKTLVYNGGGLQTAGTAVVNNSGNVMVNGIGTDRVTIAPSSKFYLRLASTTDYGQLYIAGPEQGNISGKVDKEYRSDYLNGATGRQQTALPFYNFTIPELVNVFGSGNLNVTNVTNNSSGRFNFSSAFWWNNARARFDQIAYSGTAYDAAGTPNPSFIKPTTYYILPRRRADGSYFWVPNADKVTFIGTPASDAIVGTVNNVQVPLSGGFSGSFGPDGSGSNFFGERYYSYIDDPFRNKVSGWHNTDYGKNLYHLANPFLTNIDLKYIGTGETGNLSDGNHIINLVGIAYYTTNNLNWSAGTGTTYASANTIVANVSGGAFQVGDVTAKRLIIKPMGEFMVKLNNSNPSSINLSNTRRFQLTSRADGTPNGVAAAKGASADEDGTEINIPADKVVKQVAVVMYDLDGLELERTYYAVSPSAITGYDPAATMMQAYAPTEKLIYTKEEKADGGEDTNYSNKLYINEANEMSYKSKLIPLYVNYQEQPYQLKFEVYEKGERVPDGLSDGTSFYFKNAQGQFVKIVDGDSISMNGTQNLGLSYELPTGGTLGTDNANLAQTIIAKKDNNWIVRFAKNWNNAKVEVYSAAGQLVHTKSQVSTANDYLIPLNHQAKSIFLVRVTSEKGEVVIKKILN